MKKITLSILFILVLALAGPAAAQEATPPGFIGPPDQLPAPGLTIAYQRVDVTIQDQVATTHIDQLFVNNNDWMMEGTYLFPLPEGAAVTQLTMWVDGQPIEAKILDANQARAIYDEIVRQLRDPALLEYVGTGAIQANVFPIPPRDQRRIEIEYSQVLTADNGLFHYVYPQSSNLYTNLPLQSQSIRVEIVSNEAIRAIYSPSHAVAIDRPGEFRATVGYEANNVLADQDFELYYTVSPEDIGLNLLSYKEAGQDGFFLLLVAPTIEVDPNQVVARDIILVLDTSGSMHGEKLAQAQAAARYLVDNLNPQDRFNIVSFSTGTRSYARGLTPAGDAGDYVGFINSLEAIGGTNIAGALLEAVQQADAERPLTILFLTDGLATEGIVDTPQLLNTIEQAAPASTRLFAFGVGDDVDTLLLDSLAQNHRGTTTYVRPGQAIDEAVSSFYAKVSTPVLADISLDFGDIVVDQLYPTELPDLFAGTQLALAGRYRAGGPATITLRGEVNGQPQTFVYEDNVFRQSGGDAFIPRLWATRAIGHLLNEIRLHGESPELVQSIVNLSIRYGIITPYTSYLIEEDDIFTQTGRDTIIEESLDEFAAPAEVSGEAAVDRAAAANELAGAEAPLPAATAPAGKDGLAAATEAVQYVGSKAFVYRDGVWIDTAYDADQYTPQQVGFASDAYFDLLNAAPELGPYLALGERVLVVFGNQAYEVVPGTGDNSITLPDVPAEDSGNVAAPTPAPAGTDSSTPPTATPAGTDSTATNNPAGSSLCTAALIMPLLVGAGFLAFPGWRRAARQQDATGTETTSKP